MSKKMTARVTRHAAAGVQQHQHELKIDCFRIKLKYLTVVSCSQLPVSM